MNIRCPDCGLQINPNANTHGCQPIGSTISFEVCGKNCECRGGFKKCHTLNRTVGNSYCEQCTLNMPHTHNGSPEDFKENEIKGEKIILDACCGNRMMWVNKKHPAVLYHDQRAEVNPDIVGDFRDLKDIKSGSMKLVVIDPPHDIYHRKANENAGFQKNFGNLNPDTWQEDIKKGLAECWRVLENNGVLIFKWNTHDAKLHKIMPLLPAEPLFMNKLTKLNSHNSETIWFCFMKF